MRCTAIFSLLATALFITGCGNSSPTAAPLPNSLTATESHQAPEPSHNLRLHSPPR